MSVYLCGPINGCTDAEANDWRQLVIKTLGGDKCIDPMRRDYRGRELEPGIAREIVNGDIEDIRKSDVMLVSYSKPSVGTAMEVFFAHSIGVPVLIVAPADEKLSPWLTHHATAIFNNYGPAINTAEAFVDHARARRV